MVIRPRWPIDEQTSETRNRSCSARRYRADRGLEGKGHGPRCRHRGWALVRDRIRNWVVDLERRAKASRSSSRSVGVSSRGTPARTATSPRVVSGSEVHLSGISKSAPLEDQLRHLDELRSTEKISEVAFRRARRDFIMEDEESRVQAANEPATAEPERATAQSKPTSPRSQVHRPPHLRLSPRELTSLTRSRVEGPSRRGHSHRRRIRNETSSTRRSALRGDSGVCQAVRRDGPGRIRTREALNEDVEVRVRFDTPLAYPHWRATLHEEVGRSDHVDKARPSWAPGPVTVTVLEGGDAGLSPRAFVGIGDGGETVLQGESEFA